jgi:exodeoxyribonuclease-5
MRERRGFEAKCRRPATSLVCLRNNRKKGLFNGGLWMVKERGARKGAKTGIMTMRLLPDDETGNARREESRCGRRCFIGGIEHVDWQRRKPYDEFDYGYVLTVHKAQGSQWDDVVLFDESFAFPRAASAGSTPASRARRRSLRWWSRYAELRLI